jgi:hypothetical protein
VSPKRKRKKGSEKNLVRERQTSKASRGHGDYNGLYSYNRQG